MADPSTQPHIACLLDFISKPESGGNWNAYFRHANSTSPVFADMTLDQILAWQRQFTVSSAAGRYQFMRATLTGLKAALKLPGDMKFTNSLQDTLALRLLNERGFSMWLEGKLSDAAFARSIACEWASLPDPNTGSSVYAHDGLNKSLVTYAEVEACLKQVKALAKVQLAQAQLASTGTVAAPNPAPKTCD